MAGTIPLSMSQQFDEFGKPLSGGLLYIMQAGSVNTPQNPYQDYGLTILQPNPIPLDAAGRVPQFFLADGFVKIRLTNSVGVTQIARDGVLVVGPSSGSGGGGGVDPTTLIQTGNMILRYGIGILAGYTRLNGLTIGNSLSGATERANSDTQAQWIYLYGVDSALVVSGGRTGNALNDYNANKQLAVPDWRGYAFGALDGMGNSLAGRLTTPFFGAANPDLLGAVGGDEKRTLTAAQCALVAHQHDVFLKDNQHSHFLTNTNEGGIFSNNGNNAGTPVFLAAGNNTTKATTSVASNITIGSVNGTANDNKTASQTQANAAAAHAAVGPMKLCTVYMKL